MSVVETLNVTQIEPRLKHPTVFKYFDALQAGEAFAIENDHDPKPLYYEILAERGNIFTWEYLQQGPEVFTVVITKNQVEENSGEIEVLCVSALEPRLKHPTVFKYFDALQAGEAFAIENDHDPKPLYYELLAERGNIFTWEYLQQGPEVFKVKIQKNPNDESGISEKDIQKAELLKAKGVQFSCNSNKQKVEEVSTNAAVSASFDAKQWDLGFLVDYIINTHHRYIKENAENLNDLANRVADHHGAAHPELNRLATAVYHFLQDLVDHITKEEEVLFPVIKQMITKKNNPEFQTNYEIGTLEDPISILRKEHEIAQHDLSFFRILTNDYEVPKDACSSYVFLFKQLQDFEKDLKIHFQLENSILYPKACAQDEALAQA